MNEVEENWMHDAEDFFRLPRTAAAAIAKRATGSDLGMIHYGSMTQPIGVCKSDRSTLGPARV